MRPTQQRDMHARFMARRGGKLAMAAAMPADNQRQYAATMVLHRLPRCREAIVWLTAAVPGGSAPRTGNASADAFMLPLPALPRSPRRAGAVRPAGRLTGSSRVALAPRQPALCPSVRRAAACRPPFPPRVVRRRSLFLLALAGPRSALSFFSAALPVFPPCLLLSFPCALVHAARRRRARWPRTARSRAAARQHRRLGPDRARHRAEHDLLTALENWVEQDRAAGAPAWRRKVEASAKARGQHLGARSEPIPAVATAYRGRRGNTGAATPQRRLHGRRRATGARG